MKKLIYLICLVGLVSLFNACSAGYVSVEPIYQESYRPIRPGESYIWIEGDWYWNNRTRTYYRRDGYWTMSRPGHHYQPGHWAKARRGYRWIPGDWR